MGHGRVGMLQRLWQRMKPAAQWLASCTFVVGLLSIVWYSLFSGVSDGEGLIWFVGVVYVVYWFGHDTGQKELREKEFRSIWHRDPER